MKKTVMLLVFLLIPKFADAIPCNVSISIDAETSDSGKIEFYNMLSNSSFAYTIEYWAEDIDGNIIKRKINTTNQKKKSFTPTNPDDGVIIKSRIASLGCEDANYDDNFAQKNVFFGSSTENFTHTANFTHKSIKIFFEINKDLEKLGDFSNMLNLSGKNYNNLGNISLQTKKYNKKPEENKVRNVIPHFLIALTTLISIVLIWRR